MPPGETVRLVESQNFRLAKTTDAHTAGTTIDTWTRRIEFAFGNIQRVADGEAARSVVNGA